MFRVAKSMAPWSTIQYNPGCTLAGPRSLCSGPELWAAAGWEAAEGTAAARGRMQPGCKASGWEGSQDRWLPDMLVAVLLRLLVHGRVVLAWAEPRSPGELRELHILGELQIPGELAVVRIPGELAEPRSPAALVRGGRFDTAPPGRPEAAQVLHLAAAGTAEEWW